MSIKNKIAFLDLHRQYAGIGEDIRLAIDRVLTHKQFILGPEVRQLEDQLSRYIGVKHAIGVSSGTDALMLALMGLGIKAGDEVITTPFSFFATAGSIARVGADPVFVDIDPLTCNIDPQQIEAAITSRTKAILPVHLFGQVAKMEEIMAIADRHDLFVIEDAAQALGAFIEVDGQKKQAGSFGDMGCFSFFPSKNLGCCGDGGLVVTNNSELAERCRQLRVHGSNPKYYHQLVGGNFRLDTIQAAILCVKLAHLDQQNQCRRMHARDYNNRIVGDYQRPQDHGGMTYNQYTLQIDCRDDICRYLSEKGVPTQIYYPVPLHRQACFSYLRQSEQCVQAVKVADRVFSIPIYPELTNDECHYIVACLNNYTH